MRHRAMWLPMLEILKRIVSERGGMVILLGGAESIRDVIAFPKTQRAQDPLTDAPSAVTPEQLKELRIKLDLVD